ncbi:hypothetical protein GJV06_00915 [Enterobacteriaceae bacterium RIT691]|nr:hypothetical protein [Enterobacteriaceae bacterium RIT691]
MHYNQTIMDRIGSDKDLALRLDHAFAGVKDGAIDALNSMSDGATRILYYTSCLTDNYQDVCNKLQEEDKRFALGLLHLVKDYDLIYHMILLYIKVLLRHKNASQKKSILERVVSFATSYAVGQVSDAALMYSITRSICLTYQTTVAIDSALGKVIGEKVAFAAAVLSGVGKMQKAADSANNLKKLCPQFYQTLYDETLEMMYFLIEPIIIKNGYFNVDTASDEKIAATLRNMLGK